jgi:hypothetical protein
LRAAWRGLLTKLGRRLGNEPRQREATDARQAAVSTGRDAVAALQSPVLEAAARPAPDPIVEEARVLIMSALQAYSIADLFRIIETADAPAVQHLILDLYLQALQKRGRA